MYGTASAVGEFDVLGRVRRASRGEDADEDRAEARQADPGKDHEPAQDGEEGAEGEDQPAAGEVRGAGAFLAARPVKAPADVLRRGGEGEDQQHAERDRVEGGERAGAVRDGAGRREEADDRDAGEEREDVALAQGAGQPLRRVGRDHHRHVEDAQERDDARGADDERGGQEARAHEELLQLLGVGAGGQGDHCFHGSILHSLITADVVSNASAVLAFMDRAVAVWSSFAAKTATVRPIRMAAAAASRKNSRFTGTLRGSAFIARATRPLGGSRTGCVRSRASITTCRRQSSQLSRCSRMSSQLCIIVSVYRRVSTCGFNFCTSRSLARKSQVLTVPTGTCRVWAISFTPRSSRYLRVTQDWYSWGSSRMAWCSRSLESGGGASWTAIWSGSSDVGRRFSFQFSTQFVASRRNQGRKGRDGSYWGKLRNRRRKTSWVASSASDAFQVRRYAMLKASFWTDSRTARKASRSPIRARSRVSLATSEIIQPLPTGS